MEALIIALFPRVSDLIGLKKKKNRASELIASSSSDSKV